MEIAVTELVEMLKAPLTKDELKNMIPEEATEPDVYTVLMNTFTQRNTEALVKCNSFCDVMTARV